MHTEFNEIMLTIKHNEALTGYLEDHDLPSKQLRFAASGVIHAGNLRHEDRCKLSGIEYKRKDYYAFAKSEHTANLITLIDDIVNQAGGLVEEVKKRRSSNTGRLTSDELMDGLSETFRDESIRPSDRAKIATTYIALEEKTSGSGAMKPWERIWMKVIMPSLSKSILDKMALAEGGEFKEKWEKMKSDEPEKFDVFYHRDNPKAKVDC